MRVSWKDLIDKLPHVMQATHRSNRVKDMSPCFEGTRISVLDKIKAWINSDDGECVFWLNGMAGSGKTAIARTIVEKMKENEDVLLASFFFSKDDEHARDHRRVFPTLAYQLAPQRSQIKIALAEIIELVGNCSDHPLAKQSDELILIPLEALNDPCNTVLFIIDALDECSSKDGASRILQTLSEHDFKSRCKLRIFITSRPEEHIRSVFYNVKNLARISLYDIERENINSDIDKYARHELKFIFAENDLPPPDDIDIMHMVEKSDGLFVYAATALRFIGDKNIGDPQGQLSIILGSKDPLVNPYSAVDSLYLQALTKIIPKDEAIQKQIEMQNAKVIRTIVTLREPLPVTALASFTGMTTIVAKNAVDSLQSVILVPSLPNAPLRIFHPSFTDFVTSKERCMNSNFLVHVPTQEELLGHRCLEIIIESLRHNVADIEDETTQNVDINGSKEKVEKGFSSELRYACLHWASHVIAIEHADEKCQSSLDQFTRRCFLNWVEAMNLLEEVPRAILMVRDVHAWAVSGHWPDYTVTDDILI